MCIRSRLSRVLLCGSLCDLCASVVSVFMGDFTTETQRSTEATQRIIRICIVLILMATSIGVVVGQSPNNDGYKFELGGQVSLLNLSAAKVVSTTPIPCFVAPCPLGVTIGRARETEPGFGVRFGYRAGTYVIIEAETNFFPRDRFFEDGRKVEGLFGAKVGKRSKKTGLFGKARPGFLYASKGDFQFKQDSVCIAIFPPPVGCFDSRGKTGLALDVGGVVELYPSRRTIVRFDAGDNIIHFGDRHVPVLINPPTGATFSSRVVVIPKPSETTHNLQVTVGVGFRF